MIYAVIGTNVLVSALITHYPQTPKVISPADFLKVMMDSKEE